MPWSSAVRARASSFARFAAVNSTFGWALLSGLLCSCAKTAWWESTTLSCGVAAVAGDACSASALASARVPCVADWVPGSAAERCPELASASGSAENAGMSVVSFWSLCLPSSNGEPVARSTSPPPPKTASTTRSLTGSGAPCGQTIAASASLSRLVRGSALSVMSSEACLCDSCLSLPTLSSSVLLATELKDQLPRRPNDALPACSNESASRPRAHAAASPSRSASSSYQGPGVACQACMPVQREHGVVNMPKTVAPE